MKKILALTAFWLLSQATQAQKVITDATIIYGLSVASQNKEAGMADAFDGATLTVYMKGNQVLSELKSFLLNQTIIYDGKIGSAVILKESGDQKFITHLTPDNWVNYNQKYEGLSYTFTDETKTVAGVSVKKAVGKLTLKDGSNSEFTVWYAPSLVPAVKGYDYQFKALPGCALEYEVQNGALKIKYTATKVQTSPVPAFKFDIPQTGYRILDYNNH